MTRSGDAWMPADEYGRAMPTFSVNLLVRNLSRSLNFYEQVLGADHPDTTQVRENYAELLQEMKQKTKAVSAKPKAPR